MYAVDYNFVSFFNITSPGHYFVREGVIIKLSREDLMIAYQANNYLPVWTFNTSEGYRIRFSFEEFGFYWNNYAYNLLNIGDGFDTESSRTLATFGGRYLPSDVTSVSNGAWLKVNGHLLLIVGYGVLELNMTITSVPISGMLLS